MEGTWARLRAWNHRWQDLPRKGLMVALTCAAAWGAWRAAPLGWPFLIGWAVARLVEPAVALLTRPVGRFRLPRAVASAALTLTVYGLVALAGWAIIARVAAEVAEVARAAPELIRPALGRATELVTEALGASESLAGLLNSLLAEAGKLAATAATRLSTYLASGAVTTAASVPGGLLAVVLTVMGTFYFSCDRARIAGFIRRTLPEGPRMRLAHLGRGMKHALGRQVRAQMLVSLAIAGVVLAGLAVMRKPHAALLALVIGLGDALPVVGAGLFLIPWSAAGFLTGDAATGVGMAVLYVLTVATRQVLEPRIVGRSLGLYPLATMMSMYAGYRLMGFAGLLAGPVLLSLCRLVLRGEEASA